MMAMAAGGTLLVGDTGRDEAARDRRGEAAEMRRIAGQLEEDNPSWIVVFGVYTRQFIAFPRFDSPRGTVVTASYPAALPPRMRAVEVTVGPAVTSQEPGPEPGDADTVMFRLAG
jgi:hypothetical protein